jgi:hydrogenase maturation protease
MDLPNSKCLILACGNTLRGDDGIGPWLASWADERFSDEPRLQIMSRQQWTPDLAADIAAANSVIFIDCSSASAPGSVCLVDVRPAESESPSTHQVSAEDLLGLARKLYSSLPRAFLLTVGAGSLELGEKFSAPVLDAIPLACERLEQTVLRLLIESAPLDSAQRE